MYRLEETRNAHALTERCNEDGYYGDPFRLVSRHRTLSAAMRALRRHEADMRRACGAGAWSHHHRIVGAQPEELEAEIDRQAMGY